MDKQRRNELKRATFLNRHVSPLQNHGGKIPRGPKHLHCGQVCFLIQDGQYCSTEPELWRRTGDEQGMKDMGKNRQGTDLVALATAGPAPPRGLRPSGLWLDRGSRRPATAATWCSQVKQHPQLLGCDWQEAPATETACLRQRTKKDSGGACLEHSPQRISLGSVRKKLNITCPRAGKFSCLSERKEKARSPRKTHSPTNIMKSEKNKCKVPPLATGHLLCAKHFARSFPCVMFHVFTCD